MLISLPNAEGEYEIERWNDTNMLTFDVFKAFWQEVSPDLHFPGTIAGDDATYSEWEGEEYGVACKFQGMRNAAGKKSGIVRSVSEYGTIQELTYFEDKLHGLAFGWNKNNYGYAFNVRILKHGEFEAHIRLRDDWSEYSSKNKEYILKNDGLSLFKP